MQAVALSSPVNLPIPPVALLPFDVVQAAHMISRSVVANVFDITPIADEDLLDSDMFEAAFAEAAEAEARDFEALSNELFDQLTEALFNADAGELVVVPVASADPEVEDQSYLEVHSWRMLFESIVSQPVLISDAESTIIETAVRREVYIEFSAFSAKLWENGAGSTPGNWLTCEVACGMPSLLPSLVNYLRYRLHEAGLDRSQVGECFSQSLIRNMLETGIARVGLEDIAVPGLKTILATYYCEVVRKVAAKACDKFDDYEAITLSAPDWLLPYVAAARQLHPSITVVSLDA